MSGRKLALRHRFIDRPGGRKQHQGAVPPIGGLIIVPVFTLLYFLTVPDAANDIALFAGLFILLFTGLIDDRYNLRAAYKFAVQFAAALIVIVYGDAGIDSFGDILGHGDMSLGFVSVPFTALCLVMVMNALNMMDGLDGLAGGVSLVVLLVLLAGGISAGLNMNGVISLIVPLLVFLYFNMRHPGRPKAAVFLGDSGSLTLGLILGWMCIQFSKGVHLVFPPVAVIWILAVPVIDALTLFFLRLLRGRHPFSADRNHLHHRFLARGFSVGATVWWVMGAAAVTGAMALAAAFSDIPECAFFFIWLAGAAFYMAFSLRPAAGRMFDEE